MPHQQLKSSITQTNLSFAIHWWGIFRRSRPDVFCKKVFIEISQNLQESYRPGACNFIKKETQPIVFSCEYCKISKNISLKSASSGYLWILTCSWFKRLSATWKSHMHASLKCYFFLKERNFDTFTVFYFIIT